MAWTKTGIAALAGLVLLLLIAVAILVLRREKSRSEETPVVVSQPIDDAFWVNLDLRRSDKYREQLKSAPQVLVVRETHYPFNSTNGMGAHYGWLDGKMANLHITFSELVDRNMGLVPARWVNGRTTDLDANSTFLQSFGLELVQAKRPQEWLVMEHVR